MVERLSIISERVDDIPLLLAQLEQMGVRPLLDVYFPAHGHWVGLSLGWVAEVWLIRILVGQRTIGCSMSNLGRSRGSTPCAWCTGQPIHPLDVGADRLAGVLEALREDDRWAAC